MKTVGTDKLNRSAPDNFVDGQSSALASDINHIGPAQSRMRAQEAEEALQQAHVEFRKSMYNNSPIEVLIENRSIKNDSSFTRKMQYTTGYQRKQQISHSIVEYDKQASKVPKAEHQPEWSRKCKQLIQLRCITTNTESKRINK